MTYMYLVLLFSDLWRKCMIYIACESVTLPCPTTSALVVLAHVCFPLIFVVSLNSKCISDIQPLTRPDCRYLRLSTNTARSATRGKNVSRNTSTEGNVGCESDMAQWQTRGYRRISCSTTS